MSHHKTIPLPGYAGRLGGRGGYHRRAGLAEEVDEPHAVAALPASRHFPEFVRKFTGDLGAAVAAGDVAVGDRLGLYHARWRRAGPRQWQNWPPARAPMPGTSSSGWPAWRPADMPATTTTSASGATFRQFDGQGRDKARAGYSPAGGGQRPGAARLIAELIQQVNAVHYRT